MQKKKNLKFSFSNLLALGMFPKKSTAKLKIKHGALVKLVNKNKKQTFFLKCFSKIYHHFFRTS